MLIDFYVCRRMIVLGVLQSYEQSYSAGERRIGSQHNQNVAADVFRSIFRFAYVLGNRASHR